MEREKKREMATYYKLHLDRQAKSRAKRDGVAAAGVYVFIGEGTTERPFLKVPKASYVKVWQNTAAALTAKHGAGAGDRFNLLRPKIERETYARLATRAADIAALESSFADRHGRPMTPREKELYGAALAREPAPVTPADGARQVRKIKLTALLDKIRRVQTDNPGNLQKAWAATVGAEAAMETVLEKVDPAKGLAYCRSQSSVRRHALHRRNAALAARLGKELNLRIEKIIFR